MDATLKAWLTLSQIRGVGGETMRHLLMEFGSPETALGASHSALRKVVKTNVAQAICDGLDDTALTATQAWLSQTGNHIVTLGDADYPQNLLNTSSPPCLLYVKGRLDLLNVPALGIVGSRHATTGGINNAQAFAESLSTAGLCIISGMAHGIDAAAHRGALKGVGSSIAVVGTGLDRVYPAAHHELAHALSKHGTLISEFPIGTPPLAANFPRRNRIISGMSLGCLVVEATLNSGSLITARLALEQNREVFAIPGSIHAAQSKGCHTLIKQGAKLVESAQDILEELHFQASHPAQAIETTTDGDNEILSKMGFDPIALDQLSQLCGLTVAELSAMLLMLELDGRVCVLPGGLYQRTT